MVSRVCIERCSKSRTLLKLLLEILYFERQKLGEFSEVFKVGLDPDSLHSINEGIGSQFEFVDPSKTHCVDPFAIFRQKPLSPIRVPTSVVNRNGWGNMIQSRIGERPETMVACNLYVFNLVFPEFSRTFGLENTDNGFVQRRFWELGENADTPLFDIPLPDELSLLFLFIIRNLGIQYPYQIVSCKFVSNIPDDVLIIGHLHIAMAKAASLETLGLKLQKIGHDGCIVEWQLF